MDSHITTEELRSTVVQPVVVIPVEADSTNPLTSNTAYNFNSNSTSAYPSGGNSTFGQTGGVSHGQTGSTAGYQAGQLSNDASYKANELSNKAADKTNQVSNDASRLAHDTSNKASDVTRDASNKAAQVSNDASKKASQVTNDASNKASQLSNDASNKASQLSNDASKTAQKVGNNISATANNAATGLRQRANHLGSSIEHVGEHPAVQNAKEVAAGQVGQFRQFLGKSPLMRDLEKRTNVDRVYLFVAAVFAYLLLIPLNLFGLALPTTTALCLLPASLLAIQRLEKSGVDSKSDDDEAKDLLSYFVVLGFVQFVESAMAGFLERRIPQYYTVKLAVMAYLLHPKTRGASQVHANVLRPILSSTFADSSSSYNSTSSTSVSAKSNNPFNSTNTTSSNINSSSPGNDSTTRLTTPPTGYNAYASPAVATTGTEKIHLPSGGGTGVGADVRV